MTRAIRCPDDELATGKGTSGWTANTLAVHLITKIADTEKALNLQIDALQHSTGLALAAADKAVLKAEVAADRRAEASNEIRAAMIDQQKNFADKTQTDFRFGIIERRMEELREVLVSMTGRSSGVGLSLSVLVQIISSIASVGAIIAVVLLFTRN